MKINFKSKPTQIIIFGIIVIISLLIYFMISTNSSSDLTGKTFYNVRNKLELIFEDEENGLFNNQEMNYTIEENVLTINVDNVSKDKHELEIVEKDDKIELIFSDSNTYYVEESEYEEAAKKVQEETLNILQKYDYWRDVKTGYSMMSFLNTGLNYMINNKWYDMTWEYYTNDSIKVTIDTGDGKSTATLAIATFDNGDYGLVNVTIGEMMFKPFIQ